MRAVGGTAAVLRLDIGDVSSFASFTSELGERLERWGASRLDILVNNAGVGIFGPLEDVTTDDFDTVMGTNVRGTFFLIQSLVPLLAQGGRVINVSTSLTRHTSPATSVYSASEAAVEAPSRTLAAELGPRGIRVNSVAPGPTALGRVGEPEEIGDAIATLASEGLRWVTAQRIEVSGGALL
ncbi:SDR family NAD(P)-dependent oxidoreductase [Streptomyces misionensis]|uniref:SDR family NAD(P)-dependent oxidoreductase n=1 Tax=Streptomyces misionensis TaxID=67331 RepID=UPI0033D4CC14